ncbi:hypothetical protein DFQ28_006603 [Apophysomyces sp. BC1034]|nr:hypothetical protein DFQ30_003383 [Apophysomyces sp. BC1015]KAG0183011.1 hypothetical protein DFQ29_000822 [Apophysomyces sp. BC1021]KAG0194754.1 hypothetical protein DFQ28_006603 [Apophysomyces sp. BC1034]
MKKGKKSLTSIPQLKPSTSTHKSRVSDEDRVTLASLYSIKINDHHTPDTFKQLIDDYERNMDDQSSNISLLKRPLAYDFLNQDDEDGMEGEKKLISDDE